MKNSSEKPIGPMLPTEDGFLEYVAMENEMTGAFPAVTEKEGDAYDNVFQELYGKPLGYGSGVDERVK